MCGKTIKSKYLYKKKKYQPPHPEGWGFLAELI